MKPSALLALCNQKLLSAKKAMLTAPPGTVQHTCAVIGYDIVFWEYKKCLGLSKQLINTLEEQQQ